MNTIERLQGEIGKLEAQVCHHWEQYEKLRKKLKVYDSALKVLEEIEGKNTPSDVKASYCENCGRIISGYSTFKGGYGICQGCSRKGVKNKEHCEICEAKGGTFYQPISKMWVCINNRKCQALAHRASKGAPIDDYFCKDCGDEITHYTNPLYLGGLCWDCHKRNKYLGRKTVEGMKKLSIQRGILPPVISR